MKRLVVVGGGTAGTILANRARLALDRNWSVSVVDPAIDHLYQPGLLFLPFGGAKELTRPRASTFDDGVTWVRAEVVGLDPARKCVALASGETLPYDVAVLASGAEPRPELTSVLGGVPFGGRVHHFYDLPAARALAETMAEFGGGRLVVGLSEAPAKCPSAPLEFLFLAEEHLTRRGLRGKVELAAILPRIDDLTGASGRSRVAELFARKRIAVEDAAPVRAVDGQRGVATTVDGREFAFDLLVTVPTHGGSRWVQASGLGDPLGFVPTDPRTLRARGLDDVFVLGDANDLPTAKAGAVAHFEAEVLADAIVAEAAGTTVEDLFVGYDVEWPPPREGSRNCVPPSLAHHGSASHWGKLAFQWMYWNVLLPGRPATPSETGSSPTPTNEFRRERVPPR